MHFQLETHLGCRGKNLHINNILAPVQQCLNESRNRIDTVRQRQVLMVDLEAKHDTVNDEECEVAATEQIINLIVA